MTVLRVSLATSSHRSLVVCLALAAGLAAAIGTGGWAAEQEVPLLGEQLVRQFWEAVRTADVDALHAILAPGFQSIHQDGARSRDEELALLAAIDISDYTLTGFAMTRQGATMVVTYMASVEETLAGTRTTATPAPRMAVFLMTESGWQLLAIANLKPMGSDQ
jgi:hypothetical protein